MNSSTLKSLRLLLAAASLASAALGVQAQELKIGYVSTDKVLRDALPAKAAQTKLEAEFSKREKDLNEIGNRLKAAGDKFEKDQPTLAESEKSRRQRDLLDQDREFQEDLNQRKNEELAAVVERANKVIKQIFETEKYDIILQDVVFASPRIDITDKVIKALNAQQGGK